MSKQRVGPHIRRSLDIPSEIEIAERRLRAAGYTIQEFCDKAKIARASWWRWGSGKNIPNAVEWDRAMRVITELCGKKKRAA